MLQLNSPKPTRVIFRRWRPRRGECYQMHHVVALFPEEPWNISDWDKCTSYMHWGQHGAAHPEWVVQHSTPVSVLDQDVLDLMAELREYGYRDLAVVKRLRPIDRTIRQLKVIKLRVESEETCSA